MAAPAFARAAFFVGKRASRLVLPHGPADSALFMGQPNANPMPKGIHDH